MIYSSHLRCESCRQQAVGSAFICLTSSQSPFFAPTSGENLTNATDRVHTEFVYHILLLQNCWIFAPRRYIDVEAYIRNRRTTCQACVLRPHNCERFPTPRKYLDSALVPPKIKNCAAPSSMVLVRLFASFRCLAQLTRPIPRS